VQHSSAVDQLFSAIRSGQVESIRALVREDPQLASARDAQGVSAILLARYHARREIADLLEACGVILDVFEAAAAGRTDLVTALIDGDSTLVNAFAADGFTPLGLAAFFGHVSVVRVLLDLGAQVNAVSRNSNGYTALTAAVTRDDAPIVELLLARGANAAYRYGPGYSPIHAAAANGSVGIARMLVAHGADPRAVTADGKRPRDLAAEKGHVAMMAWLDSLG
jgi:ankyrin repeat protein